MKEIEMLCSGDMPLCVLMGSPGIYQADSRFLVENGILQALPRASGVIRNCGWTKPL